MNLFSFRSYIWPRVVHYAPEIEKSMAQRLTKPFLAHSSETFSLKHNWNTLDSYHSLYANDGLFLYGLKVKEFLLKNETTKQDDQTLLDRLRAFRDFFVVMDEIKKLMMCFHHLHSSHHVKGSMSNFTSYSAITSEELIKDFNTLMVQYEQYMEELEGYPEWQEKLKSEVEFYINWMHIFHQNDSLLDNITPGFNKHDYFK